MAVSALGGTAKHADLAGLATGDDHPQYALELAGAAAARPAAGRQGRLYLATDTLAVSYDTGSAWIDFGAGAAGFRRSFLFGNGG